jgi:hypothetical protein
LRLHFFLITWTPWNTAKVGVKHQSIYSGARVAQCIRLLDLTTHTSLSPIRRGFAPSFVNYKKGVLESQQEIKYKPWSSKNYQDITIINKNRIKNRPCSSTNNKDINTSAKNRNKNRGHVHPRIIKTLTSKTRTKMKKEIT